MLGHRSSTTHHLQQQRQGAPRVSSSSWRAAARPQLPLRQPRSACAAAAGDDGGEARQQAGVVRDGRLSWLASLQQFVNPRHYAAGVLGGAKMAWGRYALPPKDTLFIGDAEVARTLMASERQLGIGQDWLETVRRVMGTEAVSMTTDPELHARLRQVLNPAFSRDAVAAMLPGLQTTVSEHLARWQAAGDDAAAAAAAGSSAPPDTVSSTSTSSGSSSSAGLVPTYPLIRLLAFEVLVRHALSMDMQPREVQRCAALFADVVAGFQPPAWDLPFTAFGKGMAARRQLVEVINEAMAAPSCSGVLARLRDEFGLGSAVAVDNAVVILFAGFDTTSSSSAFMFAALQRQPELLEQVHAEQRAVVARHGPRMTPAAVADMHLTTAVVREALRCAQVVAYVPRVATRELELPNGGPTLPAGCPFLLVLSAMSDSDPALQAAGDLDTFRPGRWLESPEAAKSLAQHQLPFGSGQRTCLGINLALAEMTVLLAELGRTYTLQPAAARPGGSGSAAASSASATTEQWKRFPILQPADGLPMRLLRRPYAIATAGSAAAVEAPVSVAA